MPKIEITLGNIVLEEVDAIVNAAHEKLMGGGGVDGAIHRAAGPGLLRECAEFPHVQPGVRCRVGEAKITSGHKLKAKYVIHTVAPRFAGSRHTSGLMEGLYAHATPGGALALARCYRNSLLMADYCKVTSIAFPSLGTGGHAYPVEEACPIALLTTIETLAETKNIQLVRFVCFSEYDYDFYQNTYAAILSHWDERDTIDPRIRDEEELRAQREDPGQT